jgi:hypothetical protein
MTALSLASVLPLVAIGVVPDRCNDQGIADGAVM